MARGRTARKETTEGLFRRGGTGRNHADDVGRVGVQVILRTRDERGVYKAAKGNVTRSFTVSDARVSDVAAHIKRALFGESDEAA